MLLSRHLIAGSCTKRFVSTQKCKRSTSQAISVSVKDNYYNKIATKGIDDKPDGWDKAKPFQDIPGPKPLPLLGNVWRFMPVFGEFYNVQLLDLHEILRDKYGDIVYLQGIPGKKPMVLLYNPDDFETVVRNEGTWPIRFGLPSYTYYRTHTKPNIYKGVGSVLTVQGEDWFKIRSIANKILMQPRTAEMYTSTMDEVAGELVEHIRHLANANSESLMPADFQNELYKWALESISVITYNKRLSLLKGNLDPTSTGQKYINSVVELFRLMYKLDVLPSLYPYISTATWRKYVKILDFITEINLKYIDDCLNSIDPDPNIPDHERTVLERLVKVDRQIAMSVTIDMLVAGIDTTGTTMATALYFLAKNPEKQTKLRSEIKQYLPEKSSKVTKEVLRDAPYLKATIKEVLRISPLVAGNLRTIPKDIILSGYRIPKGTDVVTSHIVLAKDDRYFVEANSFIPERWLRSTENRYSHKNVHPFVSLPFGFGPRACIGRRLANLELEVAISKIIRNFELSWPHPDITFGMKLFHGVEGPLRIKMQEVDN